MTDALLAEVAAAHGTPTYVYDLDLVTDRFRRVERAFPGARVHYAVKANGLGPLLAHLAALGARAEALTRGELERALRAGFAPADVVLGGPGHTPELAARAGAAGVGLVSLDSRGAWEVWRGVHAPATRFLVRLNPGFDPRTHEHLATGAAESKFGLPYDEAAQVAEEVAATGRLAGFHVHAGSMIADPEVARLVAGALDPLYRSFDGLDLVDFGGGFAVPGPDLAAFAAPLLAFAEAHGVRPIVEPGRYLVAEAGVLLTRVLHVKEGGPVRHVIADAGMADLLRPALYGARHPVRVVATPDGPQAPSVARRAGTVTTDVDGPLCENADRLARDVTLEDAGAGTLLAVEVAGAYGFAMSSNYASSLRPAQVVVAGGVATLAARREEPADLWRLEAPVAAPAEGESAGEALGRLLESMDSPARAAAALITAAAEHLRPRLGRLEDLTRAFANELYSPLIGVGAGAVRELDERRADHGEVARAVVATPQGDFVVSLARRSSGERPGRWLVTGLARDLPGA
ncbi:MAG TPA: diaminopimelate decarboxylase [Trueperaceae bacterium]|nr:diaminopimelate decarboxylase [Trueperaceae bacterium]